ncbi:MAG TPA: hypothetical protein VFV90_09940 [Usitatibacter sp.]|nr:hypothetical protein [Usitatibacter sp.]
MAIDAIQKGIQFDDWRLEIDSANDVDELVKVVRRYLVQWSPEELALLPMDLAAIALAGRGAIFGRALMASRAELAFSGTPEAHAALRNMSRVFNAAAARLSFLEAYNTIAP